MVQKKKKKAPAVKKEPEDDAADDPEVREKDVDEHPFKPGAWLVVSWPPDGSERLATVIDRARVESQDQVTPAEHTVRKDDLQERDASLWRYYVHYADFNRRMDEWVKPQRVVLPPSKSLLLAEAEGKLNPHGPKKEEEPDKPQAPRGGSGALSGGSGACETGRVTPSRLLPLPANPALPLPAPTRRRGASCRRARRARAGRGGPRTSPRGSRRRAQTCRAP